MNTGLSCIPLKFMDSNLEASTSLTQGAYRHWTDPFQPPPILEVVAVPALMPKKQLQNGRGMFERLQGVP
jgi:hypothetical protein